MTHVTQETYCLPLGFIINKYSTSVFTFINVVTSTTHIISILYIELLYSLLILYNNNKIEEEEEEKEEIEDQMKTYILFEI